MTGPWVLALEKPHGAPLRRVGGLSIALRLALDAQRAGAESVVCTATSGVLPGALRDARLRIPVVEAIPEGVRSVHVSATLLVHRDALGAAARRAEGEGQDAVTVTVENGGVETPYGFSPVEILDAEVARRAEVALFRSLRKPQDGWTSRYLNRHISLSISRLLVKTPLRPNQVSVAILAVGLAGAWLAAQGSYWALVFGAFLFQAQSVLDGCDGEMSRVTHRGSLMGEWLDTIGDDLTNYGFFAGAALGLHRHSGSKLYLAAGIVTVLCGVATSLIEYRYLAKIGSGDLLKYPTSQIGSGGQGLFAKVAPLFKRDTFVFLTLIAAVVGLLGPILVVFSLAGVGILGNVLATEVRMAQERRDGGTAA
ncbi:MAG TPA: CDP-alcohol phosphatidyltransferase family protein [Polyangiaceae bacterium]